MTTQRHGLPYVFVTWVTGQLAGDKQCLYAPWFKAHFRYEKVQDEHFDAAAWTANHTALVERRVAQLEADGWTVTLERANEFRWKGTTALLSGKPDILAVRGREARVVDCKTGKQRHSDWWQVLIYMAALRRLRPDLADLRLSGEVCYGDHAIPVEPEELTADREGAIFTMLRAIGSGESPEPQPSRSECAYCDLAGCAARHVEADSDDAPATAAGLF